MEYIIAQRSTCNAYPYDYWPMREKNPKLSFWEAWRILPSRSFHPITTSRKVVWRRFILKHESIIPWALSTSSSGRPLDIFIHSELAVLSVTPPPQKKIFWRQKKRRADRLFFIPVANYFSIDGATIYTNVCWFYAQPHANQTDSGWTGLPREFLTWTSNMADMQRITILHYTSVKR